MYGLCRYILAGIVKFYVFKHSSIAEFFLDFVFGGDGWVLWRIYPAWLHWAYACKLVFNYIGFQLTECQPQHSYLWTPPSSSSLLVLHLHLGVCLISGLSALVCKPTLGGRSSHPIFRLTTPLLGSDWQLPGLRVDGYLALHLSSIKLSNKWKKPLSWNPRIWTPPKWYKNITNHCSAQRESR